MRPIGSYDNERVPEGTKVTFTFAVEPVGIFRLGRPVFRLLTTAVRRGAAGELRRLKEILESDAA